MLYYFGKTKIEGDSSMSAILGGKGANLAQMCKIGLPIPPGFTISTKLCSLILAKEELAELKKKLKNYIGQLEAETGKSFGGENPLLLSVRSGAKISMPGMMDTILNLGMNDAVMESLAAQTNNRRFALDSFRRFLEMYGQVVLAIPAYLFEEIFDRYKGNHNIIHDSEMNEEILQAVIADFKQIIVKYTGSPIETDPFKQLEKSIEAVWKSWNSQRALTYRKINQISDDIGTAVNIQSMVFGNKNAKSATGVIFTRDPANGENKIFGEFLINAQGEDVVAGIRTPQPVISQNNQDSMQELMPKQFAELAAICQKLEAYFQDMQDIEFTIEDGKLFILQTRNGKRTAAASVKIAVNMVSEGIINQQEALMRVEPESLQQLLHTAINYQAKPKIIAKGLPASPGASTGIAVFSPYDVEEMNHHHKVILIRNDTSPEDIKAMHLSAGILTARGGMTSHAAVVARGMGRPCVCGVRNLTIDETKQLMRTDSGVEIKQGDLITIDGATGNIMLGDVELIEPEFSPEFNIMLNWADQIKELEIRANAESPVDARAAINFGASAIGLCRTEHMFFEEQKIILMRQLIIAQNDAHRQQAIEELKPLQIQDFRELFKIMDGRAINIRLLDPPLHEFLPQKLAEKQQLASKLNMPMSLIEQRLHALHELNPMLGHRGCRLGISFPEIYIMQVEAILAAMQLVAQEDNIEAQLELMIPLICEEAELIKLKEQIKQLISRKEELYKKKFDIKLGTMIELPRAALIADKIAAHVEYFSFGSNDLTQTTYGISRDDVGSFLDDYLRQKIFKHDPFTQIDQVGVGELIKIAIKRGKSENPSLKTGICGEHAGDPASIDFFQQIGLDYISCSPYRIPIARIAAARSKIKFSA